MLIRVRKLAISVSETAACTGGKRGRGRRTRRRRKKKREGGDGPCQLG